MPRYKLTIEYDGTAFHGWQRQNNAMTVQQKIEEALFAFCQERITLYGGGRTDKGVHARGQTAHFDAQKNRPCKQIMLGLNAHLKPLLVSILHCETATPAFDARRDAVMRHYEYAILNRPAPPACDKKFVWHIPIKLDLVAMQQGAKHLIGHHDFSSFRASGCQASSPRRTLSHISLAQKNDLLVLYVCAPSFLYRQVRIITGTLIDVGRGKLKPETIKDILLEKNRKAAGTTAPAHGLCLTKICYSQHEQHEGTHPRTEN